MLGRKLIIGRKRNPRRHPALLAVVGERSLYRPGERTRDGGAIADLDNTRASARCFPLGTGFSTSNAMKPYYESHSAGWLFLILVIAFFGMEIIQFFRQRGWRKNATRVATPAFWVGVAVWTVLATVMLHTGSRIAPGAGMGNGPAVFVIGMVLLAAGAALRWASFWALGQYFTFHVDVSSDQQVVTTGPYRVVRHPGYSGGLLAIIGIAVIYANWVGFAGFVVPCVIVIVWRIRIEEAALSKTAGEQYRT